jgi:tetratricopeptide (TPR) repeat protein
VSLRRWLLVLVAGLLAWGATSPFARADDSRDQEARALYEAGKLAFEEGRFENALRHFERAHELSGRPRLLYNIGTAADRLRRDDVALAAFERYVAEQPDAVNRQAVEARIAVLRAQQEAARERAREPSPPPPPSPPRAEVAVDAPPAEPASRWTPWLLLGGGAAATLAGGTLIFLGARDRAAVEDAAVGTRYSAVEDAAERAPRLMVGGSVALGVGLLGVASSSLWLRLGRPAQVSVSLSPHGVAARGAF